MTYPFSIEKIVKTDAPEDWAWHLTTMATSMIRTVRLALHNDNAGFCKDEYRISAAADTLELAEALLAVVSDGTETMSRDLKRGMWKQAGAA